MIIQQSTGLGSGAALLHDDLVPDHPIKLWFLALALTKLTS